LRRSSRIDKPLARRRLRQYRQEIGESHRFLPDMVETLHLMEDVRVAACRLLNEWTDMPLKMLQMPGKLHQFMPCTAENVGDRDLLRIGVRGDWRAAIGPHSHGRFSATYKSFFKSFSKRFSIC
jgi:hypothetical protein